MLQSQSSQDSVQYFDAGLAKRLAEAADSFRDSLYHYFICKKTFPYDLHHTAGYESDTDASDEAVSMKQGLSSDYFIFGPYKTDTDEEAGIEYDSIQLKFMQDSNELYCETLPNNADAIILSISAYDKFLQPYYIRLYGADTAATLRTSAIAALTATPRTSVIHGGKSKTSQSGTGGTRFTAGSAEY